MPFLNHLNAKFYVRSNVGLDSLAERRKKLKASYYIKADGRGSTIT